MTINLCVSIMRTGRAMMAMMTLASSSNSLVFHFYCKYSLPYDTFFKADDIKSHFNIVTCTKIRLLTLSWCLYVLCSLGYSLR